MLKVLKVQVVQEAEALKEVQNVQHVQEIQGVRTGLQEVQGGLFFTYLALKRIVLLHKLHTNGYCVDCRGRIYLQ